MHDRRCKPQSQYLSSILNFKYIEEAIQSTFSLHCDIISMYFNVFAKFDEIPLLPVQDRKTKNLTIVVGHIQNYQGQ